MITAKPVIPDQYWILRDQDNKIGNIEIDGGEYVVSLNGKRKRFTSLNLLKENIRINFESTARTNPQTSASEVHGFPTSSTAYNAVFDVQHQIPLWTSEPRSRSWLAAGWYRVRQRKNWQVVQCPKLILLQRYPFQGPFRSREEAQGV